MPVSELTVVILDRPRHEKLIDEVRNAGARIKLIKDGDVSAAIATCSRDRQVDVLMGIGGRSRGRDRGGRPALRGRRAAGSPASRATARRPRARARWASRTWMRSSTMDDLASGNVMFAATGVTSGDFLKGVRFRPQGALTQSVVMRSESMTVRYIDAEHNFRYKPL